MVKLSALRTVRALAAETPFSQASLRWMIHKADENGLAEAGAIIRRGRRVLIDSERFASWLEAGRGG